MTRSLCIRHGRAWPGHPRVSTERKEAVHRRVTPGDDERINSLTLIAREHAFHRPCPALQLALARGGAHRGLEAVFEAPVVGEFFRLRVDPGMKTGEIGGAERSGFLDRGAIYRGVEQICQALHGP